MISPIVMLGQQKQYDRKRRPFDSQELLGGNLVVTLDRLCGGGSFSALLFRRSRFCTLSSPIANPVSPFAGYKYRPSPMGSSPFVFPPHPNELPLTRRIHSFPPLFRSFSCSCSPLDSGGQVASQNHDYTYRPGINSRFVLLVRI